MDIKLFCAAFLILFSAQVHGANIQDVKWLSRTWSTYDKEHGQYSMAVLSADTTITRYQVYVLLLELTHTVKYMSQDIIALFNKTTTDPAKITALQTEFTKRGESMKLNLDRILNASNDLLVVIGMVNSDIGEEASAKMSTDKALLSNQKSSFDTIYDLSMENAQMSFILAKNKVQITIGTQTGPEIDEINQITKDAENLLKAQQTVCNNSTLVMDAAYNVAIAALDALIANAPATH